MYRGQARYGRDPHIVNRAQPQTFKAPLRWYMSTFSQSLVFTCSWSDSFHPDADDWRDDAWDIIRSPNLTFQILTKRPELIADRLPNDWGPDGYPNVWLGVSVENPMFSWRVEKLLEVSARVRFISDGPLLSGVDFKAHLATKGIGWVIVGGESGSRPHHPPRPMKLEWAQSLSDQCIESGVSYLFKQWGGRLPGGTELLDGRTWRELPVLPADINLQDQQSSAINHL